MADWRENLAESREGLAAILADIPEPLDTVNIFRRARAPRLSRTADGWSTAAGSADEQFAA